VDPRSPDLVPALAGAARRALESTVPATARERIGSLRWKDTADAMVALYRRASGI